MSAIERLIGNNAKYAANFSDGDLPIPPAMKIAVVACMDARLELASVLGLKCGDAHVIRNAGGVVTDDVIRSLTISQRLLGTEEVMIVQHTDCGMLTFRDDELKADLERDTGVRPTFSMEAFADLDTEVRQSIARIKASPFVARKDAIRGFVYEVETGRLREIT